MALEPITFASGHQLVDNGAGDYCLQCPDGHKARPTIFPMHAYSIVHRAERFECIRCDDRIGEHTGGELFFSEMPLIDPTTCNHAPGEIRSDRYTQHEGRVERLTRYECGRCGWVIEDMSQYYPGMPEYERAVAKANGGDDGRG